MAMRPPSLLHAPGRRLLPAAIAPPARPLRISARHRRRGAPIGAAPVLGGGGGSGAPGVSVSVGVGGARRRAAPSARGGNTSALAAFASAAAGRSGTGAAGAGAAAGAASACPFLPHRRPQYPYQRRSRRPPPLAPPPRSAAVDAAEALAPLGYDFLTFFATTVLMVPAFKAMGVSPVLGYLGAGFALKQLGVLQDLQDVQLVSEFGVLFLLFEMGLELSLDRLRALARFAFGMGTLQMLLCTALFAGFALPAGSSFGTWFLEVVAGAPPALVSIRSVDEAVVIGAALSLSSSAFVLQLLKERGELATRFGSATLGILLLQDIAVVPFLVLLPVIEERGGMEGMGGMAAGPLLQELGPTVLKTLAGLGLLLLGGRFGLRRVFDFVARSRSPETFVALCLLTVTGASMLTQRMGLSDTLGAFIAGVLLAETSYRAQVEADIKPFRALLLGLFFLSVGSSINIDVLRQNWDVAAWMLAGLVALKATVITSLGPLFGLSRSESLRTGLLLSQGGEFAFVLLSLACRLKLLPNDLNQILIVTVVLSMVITPALAEAGKWLGDRVEDRRPLEAGADGGAAASDGDASDGAAGGPFSSLDDAPLMSALRDPPAVVILGFGPQAQMLANMLSSPLVYERLSPSTAPGALAVTSAAAAAVAAAAASAAGPLAELDAGMAALSDASAMAAADGGGGGGGAGGMAEAAAIASAATMAAAAAAAAAAGGSAGGATIDVEAEEAGAAGGSRGAGRGGGAATMVAPARPQAPAAPPPSVPSGGDAPLPYAAFDLDPARVRAAQRAGFRVFYGDGTRASVLRAAGIDRPPRAFVVCYGGESAPSSSPQQPASSPPAAAAAPISADEAAASATERAVRAVRALGEAFPGVPAYAVAADFYAAAALREAGAARVSIAGSEAGVSLGSTVCRDLGASDADVLVLRADIERALAQRTDALVRQLEGDRRALEREMQQRQHQQLELGQQKQQQQQQQGGGEPKAAKAAAKPQQQQAALAKGPPRGSIEMFVLDRAQALTRATTAAVADGRRAPAAVAALAASSAAAAAGNGGAAGPMFAPAGGAKRGRVSDGLTSGIPIASVDEYVPERPIAPPSPESSSEEDA